MLAFNNNKCHTIYQLDDLSVWWHDWESHEINNHSGIRFKQFINLPFGFKGIGLNDEQYKIDIQKGIIEKHELKLYNNIKSHVSRKYERYNFISQLLYKCTDRDSINYYCNIDDNYHKISLLDNKLISSGYVFLYTSFPAVIVYDNKDLCVIRIDTMKVINIERSVRSYPNDSTHFIDSDGHFCKMECNRSTQVIEKKILERELKFTSIIKLSYNIYLLESEDGMYYISCLEIITYIDKIKDVKKFLFEDEMDLYPYGYVDSKLGKYGFIIIKTTIAVKKIKETNLLLELYGDLPIFKHEKYKFEFKNTDLVFDYY